MHKYFLIQTYLFLVQKINPFIAIFLTLCYNLFMLKQDEIRRDIKIKRSLISSSDVERLSDIITNKVLKLDIFNAKTFFIYSSFKNEVDTSKIINFLASKTKTITYPLTVGDTMYSVKPLSNNFIKDKFGVLVPKEYEIISDVDVAFIPLIACDKNKNRIGFGKGYYDKFLSGKNILKIGLSFDFQVIDHIPSNSWDVKLDLIITNKQIIK